MPQINILDKNTIDKIAAGEVIDRPSSIVKEMLENAIDAKATAVTIEIKEGGISFIRITDNGEGIRNEDIRLAFLRHATSKIKSVEDLLSVNSLGFRGEALSSISAVAQVECITKTRDALTGIRYVIEGGEEKTFEEVGAPCGTTFVIRNLFYNTPARRKFLKTATTEGSYINSIIERIAMSHPNVSIRFINNSTSKLHTSGNSKLKEIIYSIYGRDVTNNLIPIDVTNDSGMHLSGFVGKPIISRGNRNYMNYYINERYIKSKIVNSAIEDAYKTFLMQHNYPFCVLHFRINQELIDVNVHPSKMELRFEEPKKVYDFIFESVNKALTHKELIPKTIIDEASTITTHSTKGSEKPLVLAQKKPSLVSYKPLPGSVIESSAEFIHSQSKKKSKAPEPFEVNRIKEETNDNINVVVKENSNSYSTNSFFSKPKFNNSNLNKDVNECIIKDIIDDENKNIENRNTENKIHENIAISSLENTNRKPSKPEQLELFDDKFLSKKERLKHKMIGQLFDTYWLIEYNDNLYIVDQHAAHEKVLFEKTMKNLKNREFTSQQLNPPIILTLNSEEEILLSKFLKNFLEIGYEIEPFGGKEYAIRAVPGNLFSISSKELLMDIIDHLTLEQSSIKSDLITEKIASMSCKAAVKGNNKLSYAEADALIEQLLTLDNPYNCPHGRPTIISMSKYELEKKFKRII